MQRTPVSLHVVLESNANLLSYAANTSFFSFCFRIQCKRLHYAANTAFFAFRFRIQCKQMLSYAANTGFFAFCFRIQCKMLSYAANTHFLSLFQNPTSNAKGCIMQRRPVSLHFASESIAKCLVLQRTPLSLCFALEFNFFLCTHAARRRSYNRKTIS